MKYRKKPVVIEAHQVPFDDSTPERFVKAVKVESIGETAEGGYRHYIETLEGAHIVSFGDFIIEGIKGEFYPCKPDIFEATYERVE